MSKVCAVNKRNLRSEPKSMRRIAPGNALGPIHSDADQTDVGADAMPSPQCESNGCHHRALLRHVLVDTIEVLEATRRSFKSKQIATLRKNLMKILTEEV
jgi:hypothetical protein